MHFSLFKCTWPGNCRPSGRHNHSACMAFRFTAHREPLPWLFPSAWRGQSKVRRVAGLQDGAGAHQHSYIVSHMSPSQAEHLSCVKAQRRQGLAPEHTPSPVGDGPLKQTAAPLCHVYGSEVCSLLASGKSRIQLDTKICF